MTEKISFHRLAEQELTDAAQYYGSERHGLGAAFLDEIERCVRFILSNPRAAPILKGSIRRRLVRRFPYGVLYSIKPDEIRILAIMNLKRRPTYWVHRE